jgi:outer membrane receptor for ferrienterochelin and colicin
MNTFFTSVLCFVLVFMGSLLCNRLVVAQTQPTQQEKQLEDLSLEDLLNVEIKVASSSQSRGLTTRESPGIVTLITEEEIRKSGARDFIDVLRLVPGFDFGVDVQGAVGISIRGNWGFEGKILVLLDGQEMNDNTYGNFMVGNHISVQQIKRVEIIRGPGSALYGGFAELAVINIITKGAETLNGLEAHGVYGQMAGGYARRGGTLNFGKVFPTLDSLHFSAVFFASEGQRSDQRYVDFQGNSYSMLGNSALNTLNANVNLRYKGLDVRFIHDNYRIDNRDKYATILPFTEQKNHINTIADAKYDIHISPSFTLTPRITHRIQYPWYGTSDTSDPVTNRTIRTTANLTASFEPDTSISIVGGAQFFSEGIENIRGRRFNFNNESSFNFTNLAVFAQGLVKTSFVNITAGARFEQHSRYAPVFVPRLALTKVIDRFHIKALYSRAFRAPALLNINLNPDIRPETSTVIELEAGYQLTNNMLLTANVFDIGIENAIVYAAINNVEKYFNFDRVETRGFELEYRWRDTWGFLTLNYAFYTAGNNTVNLYRVAGQNNVLVGFAPHVANLNVAIDITKDISISPSFRFLSTRYGQVGINAVSGAAEHKLYDAVALCNLSLHYANIIPGLTANLSAFDIFGANYAFIQPYNSLHRPLPGNIAGICLTSVLCTEFLANYYTLPQSYRPTPHLVLGVFICVNAFSLP